jgi:mono/diheme cytochrome c family protein
MTTNSLMRRRAHRSVLLSVCALLGWAAAPFAHGASSSSSAVADAPATAARAALESTFTEQIFPLLTTYCIKCHGPEKHKGDLNFAPLAQVSMALATTTVWRECAGKILLHDMPPDQEARQPTDSERDALLAWINGLKRLAPRDPGPGIIRRLSRAEYANTLHDLLGVDQRIAADLPSDSVGEGFNSTISPLLMERYLEVADEALDQIIKPDQMRVKWSAGQLDAVIERKSDPGRPEGSERRFTGPAQLTALIPAPVEGSYTLRIRAAGEMMGTKEGARLEVRVDDQIIGEVKVTAAAKSPATYPLTFKLPAGRARLSVQLANPLVAVTAAAAGDKGNAAAAPPLRAVTILTLELEGPPAATPSQAQRRLFVALPGKDLDKRGAARRIAEAFARRAFRRPPRAKEIDQLVKVFDLADGQGEVFSDAVKLMLKAVLVSPQFLFLTPDEGAPLSAAIVAIGGYQLASRLSYLLWSSMPDDELFALAASGRLGDPAVIAQQVRRMILDPRAHALFDGFGAPWLGLDKLEEQAFDEKKFPLMGKDMRKAMYAEAAMLFDSIMHEDQSIITFLDCDYTFLNEKLARIYGLEGEVKGSAMRKVQLSDANRGGILTMPGILAVSSLPNRTSPVKRGIWVLQQVLGQNLPPAPMNVPPLEKQDTKENAGLNLRQRTEMHRSDAVCASCHRVLDPIGFGLENFDAIGRWRERDDTGGMVDAVGELPGKIAFRSPQDLKRLIAARKDDFCHALVAKFLGYALCRHLDGYDEVVVDEISAAVAKDGYRLQSILVHVATSYPFLNRHLNR